MSRTLVIPDIHDKTAVVDEILTRERYDQVVFLGDYFDGSRDTPEQARHTAEWLKHHLPHSRFTFLYGNHDVPYRFPAPELRSSGFSTDKQAAIRAVLGEDDWALLRLHAWVDGWLLTHAGWDKALAPSDRFLTPQQAGALCEECLRELEAGRTHPLVLAGRGRGGKAAVGGITWQDWSELEPVAGVHQMVGHTPGIEVREKCVEGGTAVCLDTRLCHVGVLETGAFHALTTPVWDEWFGPGGRLRGALR